MAYWEVQLETHWFKGVKYKEGGQALQLVAVGPVQAKTKIKNLCIF